MDVFKDASTPLKSNKIKTDSKELLSNIKTEEIDTFEEFENFHQVNLCEIKTESCIEKDSSTKNDVLIWKENIKTENVNSNEGIQKRKSDIKIIQRTFDLPVCTNAIHDFVKNRQTVQTIKMYSRKKCFLSATKKRQPSIGKFDGTCSSCGQFFYDKWLFLNHFYVYHFLVVSKKCVNLRRNNSATKHINLKDLVKLNEQMTTHSGQKSFKCEICSKCFIHSGNFKRHIRSHSAEKPFKCETCSKCFKSSSHLKRHIRIHTDEKPFICRICSKCFRLSGDLKMHIRIHTDEKPFKCEICSKCFTGSGDLKRHIRTHTGEKPFKCETCSKCFIASCALKKHIKIHTNEKPFKCEICLKCFIGSSKLKRHIRTHTGEKPFSCEICSKCFAHNSSLKKHILKTHTC